MKQKIMGEYLINYEDRKIYAITKVAPLFNNAPLKTITLGQEVISTGTKVPKGWLGRVEEIREPYEQDNEIILVSFEFEEDSPFTEPILLAFDDVM